MRRLVFLFMVALLGIAPLGGPSARAGSWEESGAWEGVEFAEPIDRGGNPDAPEFVPLDQFLGAPMDSAAPVPPTIGARLPFVFPVTFTNDPAAPYRAYIPEVPGAEFMVIVVTAGEFVLDVTGPGSYLVDPAIDPAIDDPESDATIAILDGIIEGTDIHYELTGEFILDEKGAVCTSLCTVLPGTAVQLTKGDRIIAPAGAICVWCLLNQNVYVGEPTGNLLVYPLLRAQEFSWLLYKAESGTDGQQASATPSASAPTESLTGAVAWAYFSPQARCRNP